MIHERKRTSSPRLARSAKCGGSRSRLAEVFEEVANKKCHKRWIRSCRASQTLINGALTNKSRRTARPIRKMGRKGALTEYIYTSARYPSGASCADDTLAPSILANDAAYLHSEENS